MTPLSTVYCSTEDIAVRAAGDFLRLIPKDQVLVAGADGAISAVDPWTLTSDSVDFEACGIRQGDMVALSGVRGTPSAQRFGESNIPTLFAVDSAAGHDLSLRRKGMATGFGQSPGTIDLGGVKFEVVTLFPQIERASYEEINSRFAIDSNLPWREPGDLYDARQLRDVTALAVLRYLYLDLSREGNDSFAGKAKMAAADFDSHIERMTLRWNQGTAEPPTTIPFGARMSR